MILCCGEALIDFVPMDNTIGYRPFPGGSILNIAVGLGRLGTPVGMFTKLSTDFFGQSLVDYLGENHVDTRLVLRAIGPTTLAFVSLPRDGPQEPEYVFYANQTTDRSLFLSNLPETLDENITALHFGSISLILEPGASTYQTLMHRESGKRVLSLDPNVRPSLILDREEYINRFETWVRLVDILRLSLADLEWLFPDIQPELKILHWLSIGPALCILTLGKQGAIGYTQRGLKKEISSPTIQVVDTVGAGDSFLAALLSYLYHHGLLIDRRTLEAISEHHLAGCISYGVHAAAINCSRKGANPPYLYEMTQTSPDTFS